MSDYSQPDALAAELRRERSVRRTVKLLESKRQKIHEDLQQLITHLVLLVPCKQTELDPRILQDALQRIGDESFSQLLLEILQKKNL